jgi:hypothetical protein
MVFVRQFEDTVSTAEVKRRRMTELLRLLNWEYLQRWRPRFILNYCSRICVEGLRFDFRLIYDANSTGSLWMMDSMECGWKWPWSVLRVLSPHLPIGTEKNRGILQSRQPTTKQRIESWISQIRSGSADSIMSGFRWERRIKHWNISWLRISGPRFEH